MDLYRKYKSPLGYQTGDNGIDSYGVNHNGFSLRDEIEYQTARNNREKQLMQIYNQQGLTENYPQYTTNFWGSADNNYGFGSSNITQNIENVTKQLNNNDIRERNQSNFGENNYTADACATMEQVNNQNGIFDNIKNTANTMRQNINDGATIAVDTIRYIPESVWAKVKSIGELAADTKLAYDYLQKMKETGNQLVNTFGPGQGADIDNYYHPLLQCELAKISPTSRDWGLRLGYAKEYLMDYPKKRFLDHQSHNEIIKDSQKDLQNNLYGSNLGYNNPNRSCEDLLDDRRTPNMRKLGIR